MSSQTSRAIRTDQLDYSTNKTVNDAVVWYNYTTPMIEELREAVNHMVEVKGFKASDMMARQQKLQQNIMQGEDYYKVINHVYTELAPFVLNESITVKDRAFIRSKLIEIRDMCISAGSNSLAHNIPEYHTLVNEVASFVFKIGKKINEDYFGCMNVLNGMCRWSIVNYNTTDEQIDNILENHLRQLWSVNNYYLLHGGHGRKSVHTYPLIPADMMKKFMAHLTETNLGIVVKLAQTAQFCLDNPMVKSIGHSWTSAYRSADCYFKDEYDVITKNNTVSFAPPQEFFGIHIPNLKITLNLVNELKLDIMDFNANAKVSLESSIKNQEDLADKTQASSKEAVREVLQALLDQPATEDLGTALLAHAFGLANPSLHNLMPEGISHLPYTYHDYTRSVDYTHHIYPQNLMGMISASDMEVTDEVQEKLYQIYLETQKQERNNHAAQCANLARQIANVTTRHDVVLKVRDDAFKAYQAQV